MIDLIKLYKALEVLKPNVQWTLVDDTDSTSWTAVKAEMDNL